MAKQDDNVTSETEQSLNQEQDPSTNQHLEMKDFQSVQEIQDQLTAEKEQISNALATADIAVKEIIDKTNSMEAVRDNLLAQIEEMKKRVENEQNLILGIVEEGNKVIEGSNKLKDERDVLQIEYKKAEMDRNSKDNQILVLQHAILQRQEMVVKLKENLFENKEDENSEEDIHIVNRNKRREAQIAKLKGDLDEVLVAHEHSLVDLLLKQNKTSKNY